MAPPPRGGGGQSQSWGAWLDRNRFYVMAVIGILLVGYGMSTRGGAGAGSAKPVSLAASDEPPKPIPGAKHPSAIKPHPAASKIHAVNEPREDDKWIGLHNKYAYEVQARAKAQAVTTIFYGDSIFEAFRGSKLGIAADVFSGGPAVWAKHFKAHALDLAIAGDTASNLLWRIRNGESPRPLTPAVKAFVINIGTNDIKKMAVEGDSADLADGVANGKTLSAAIAAIVETLKEEAPDAHAVVMAVLPRGDTTKEGDAQWAQPSVYTPSIDHTNAALKAYAAAHAGSVTFVDCGAAVRAGVGGALKKEALPDTTHPSAEALEAIASGCLKPALDKVMG